MYHSYKHKDQHTVIPGLIVSIEIESDYYYVQYIKRISNKPVGCCFDDIGNTAIVNTYYYNQKSK